MKPPQHHDQTNSETSARISVDVSGRGDPQRVSVVAIFITCHGATEDAGSLHDMP